MDRVGLSGSGGAKMYYWDGVRLNSLHCSSGADNQNHCAFCDRSTKFGTYVVKGILKRFGYGAILNCQYVAHGNHLFQNGRQVTTTIKHFAKKAPHLVKMKQETFKNDLDMEPL